jgi:hypothetical protein
MTRRSSICGLLDDNRLLEGGAGHDEHEKHGGAEIKRLA